jgi:hypothetical protein
VERAWKAIHYRLRRPYYLSRVDHVSKISNRKQRKGIRKNSFINSTFTNWTQLPAEALGTFFCKPTIFRKRGNSYNRCQIKGIEVWRKSSKSEVKWSEVKWSEVKCSDVRWNGAGWILKEVKSNERLVKCSWVKFINERKWSFGKCSEVEWSEV